MSPFDKAHNFLLTFYSNHVYLVSFLRYSMSKNIMTLKFGSKVTLKVTEIGTSRFVLCFPASVL